MKEIWKPIPNHESYLCSNYGRIKNTKSNKILNGYVDNCGYVRFDLFENGKRFPLCGHRAVALTFIPSIEGKPFVNHKDGDKTNNFIENLEWCNCYENIHHAMEVLHCDFNKTKKKKVRCLENNKVYESACQVERELGIPNGMINRCCNGLRKTTKGLHWEFA